MSSADSDLPWSYSRSHAHAEPNGHWAPGPTLAKAQLVALIGGSTDGVQFDGDPTASQTILSLVEEPQLSRIVSRRERTED